MIHVVITRQNVAAAMTRWGIRLAESLEMPLQITLTRQGAPDRQESLRWGENEIAEPELYPVLQVLNASSFAEADCPHSCTLHLMVGRKFEASLLDAIDASDCVWLLVDHARGESKNPGREAALAQALFNQAACRCLMICPSEQDERVGDSILIPCAGGPHSIEALSLAGKLVENSEAHATTVHVQPFGSPDAKSASRRILDRAMRQAGVQKNRKIKAEVILAGNPQVGIEQAAVDADLLLVGLSDRAGQSSPFGHLPTSLIKADSGTAVAVVRRARQFHERAGEQMRAWVHRVIPRLSREQRIAVFGRLFESSRWDFDFIILLAVSTAIASFGLIKNSAAVVIGAMLVAPLMLPILSAGLSLAHGNYPVLRSSLMSIAYGFLTALGISFLIGLLARWPEMTPELKPPLLTELTDELKSRGDIGPFDLGIALFSGIAAAVCQARNHQSAALAGVAIAAALVPPVAAVGICLALGAWTVAGGAAILFFINVITIISGASMTFYALGVHHGGRSGIYLTFGAFVVMVIGLGLYLMFGV